MRRLSPASAVSVFPLPLALALVLALPLALGACASAAVMSAMPLSTMKRLWSFDLTRLDIASFRVAARLPDALLPREVTVTVESWGSDTTKKRREELRLVPAREAAEGLALAKYTRPGFALHAYRLAAEDARRMEEMRTATRADGGNGSIAVAVKACRVRDLPAGALTTTTLLRTDAKDYFVLFDDLDLRALVSEAELAAEVPQCK